MHYLILSTILWGQEYYCVQLRGEGTEALRGVTRVVSAVFICYLESSWFSSHSLSFIAFVLLEPYLYKAWRGHHEQTYVLLTSCWGFVPPVPVLYDSRRDGLNHSQDLMSLLSLSMKATLETGWARGLSFPPTSFWSHPFNFSGFYHSKMGGGKKENVREVFLKINSRANVSCLCLSSCLWDLTLFLWAFQRPSQQEGCLGPVFLYQSWCMYGKLLPVLSSSLQPYGL